MKDTVEQDEALFTIKIHVASIRAHLAKIERGADVTEEVQYALGKIKDIFALHEVEEIKPFMDERRKLLFGKSAYVKGGE